MHLEVIIASTRPNRAGDKVGRWFYERAKSHGSFDVELVDLAELNLPVFDEPNHPRLKKYEHEHTKAWSAVVKRADAFVLVTPEYNYGPSPSLINALDYLYREWHYKPVAFVSYGGIAGGARSVQMTKMIVTTLRMMPIPEGIVIPSFTQYIDAATGAFTATEHHEKAAAGLLKELLRWAQALRPLRDP